MASRGPRRSHRLPVVQTSSDEDELMAGLPTSSTRGQRLTKAQLDPVRAREAAITDERGQRPTKAKPDPVRAREAAITDERGQRPTKAKSDPVRAHGQQLRMNSPYAVKDRGGHSLIPYEPKGSNYG